VHEPPFECLEENLLLAFLISPKMQKCFRGCFFNWQPKYFISFDALLAINLGERWSNLTFENGPNARISIAVWVGQFFFHRSSEGLPDRMFSYQKS
jgi:hypothetical protein